jgi:hypothetical protein
VAFDLLRLEGQDQRLWPLEARQWRLRRPVWEWMAAAFCSALALAIGAMAVALVTQYRLRIGPQT